MARLNKIRFACFIIVISLASSASLPFCKECAPFIPGAVAYWPMKNETIGSDMSGNDNHARCVGLTYTGGPTGEYNGAVHFNGSSNSYAKVTNSPSMDIGKYPGFSFSGYVRYLGIQNKTASLIDWSGIKGYGMFILATSEQRIQLHLYPNAYVVNHKAEFPNNRLINGAWHFIGVSYDKASGRATVFNDGQLKGKQLDKNIMAGTAETSEIGLGIDLSEVGYSYNGDMSCMMLFKFALTADDFKRVRDFCRRTNSGQTRLPNITVSDIAKTNATVLWNQSPGIFSAYNITIERKDAELGLETTHPKFISSSETILKSVLTNLISGATYRVHVWHMQGDIVGRARSSAWFSTPSLVVESNSIVFYTITATSAQVSWKDVTGNYDGYTVDIHPTTGGAKADPSTVPRGTTTTSLQNIFPGISYTITIRTKIGSRTSSPSETSFQMLAAAADVGKTGLIVIALFGSGFIVIGIVLIVVVIDVRVLRKKRHRTSNNIFGNRLTKDVAEKSKIEEVEEKGTIVANRCEMHLSEISTGSLLFPASQDENTCTLCDKNSF